MADWVAISSLATAGRTLVLAVATLRVLNAANLSSDKWPSANPFTIDF